MAYVQTDQNEEQQAQQPGQTPQTGGGQQQAPVVAQQQPVTLSGAGGGTKAGAAGPGTQAGTGPTQAGTPVTPGGGQEPLYTNLSAYLTGNAPATQNLGNQISSNLAQQTTQAQNAITNAANQFNSDVNAGTVNYNTDLVNQALANPTQFATTPSNVSGIQSQLNAKYTGPNSFASDTNAYNPAANAISNAQNAAGQVNSTTGRENLIQQATNNNAANQLTYRNPQSAGNLSLNNALIQNTPGVLQSIQQAATPASSLSNTFNAAQTAGNANVTNAQNTTAQTAQQTQQALQGGVTNLQNAVNANVSTLQGQATQNQQALATALQTGANLTNEQLAALGLTQQQYSNLLSQEQQLQKIEGPSSNLAILGAEALAGYSPTTPSGTGANASQTAQGGLGSLLSPSSVVGAIGSAIGDAVIPIPVVGGAVGGIIGSLLGGLFGGSTPSVGPNGFTGVNIDSNGKLTVGASGADNGANPQTTINVANTATQAINSLLDANGLMINPAFWGPQGQQALQNAITSSGTHGLSIVQGSAGGDNTGGAISAAGLWNNLLQMGAIVPNPNASVNTTQALPVDLSSYLTANTPSVSINPATVATAQNYSDYAALNQLLGQQGTYLQPQNAALAGTATPYAASFNYQTAVNQLMNDIQNATTTGISEATTAQNILKQGLEG